MRFLHRYNNKIFIVFLTLLFSGVFGFFTRPAFASTIDGTIDTSGKYAWSENIGWLDFGTTQGNVHVTDSVLTGYAWGESIGWVSLNCSNDNSCSAVDYKVSNDGEGNLSGYAWSENAGWIQFNPTGGGVTINILGEFLGYAWGENTGWIIFNCATTASCATVDYKVKTDWRPRSTRGGTKDWTPPSLPTNAHLSVSVSGVMLTWTDPVDADFVSVVILRNSGGNTPISGDMYGSVAKGVQRYVDANVIEGVTYQYLIRARDANGNMDMNMNEVVAIVPVSASDAGGISAALPTPNIITLPTTVMPSDRTPTSPPSIKTPVAVSKKIPTRTKQFIDIVKEAAQMSRQTVAGIVVTTGLTRDTARETEYTSLVSKVVSATISTTEKEKVTTFVVYGTETTNVLGVGERAGVVSSFREAFNRDPQSEKDWKDLLMIANGRFPEQTNSAREKAMEAHFVKIYKRASNRMDRVAIVIMAYGLRPESRNLNSERFAIHNFRNIYGRLPASSGDWDIVRAIAYSGAVRSQ